MLKKILFIINPISGHGRHSRFPEKACRVVDKRIFKPEFIFTESPRHAIKLSKNNSDEFDIIVAVGGDGTVNEVSQGLWGSSTIMGIFPAGSGNGLARYLNIPLNFSRALEIINKLNISVIDRIKLNDQSYVNMAGVGFDAYIGLKYSELGISGMMPYFYLSLQEFSKYKPKQYSLIIDGREYSREAFTICFANSTQFGSNAYIAPDAKIDDGLIDVCFIKPFPYTEMPNIGIRLFNKTINKSKYVEMLKARHIVLYSKGIIQAHIDGEPIKMKDKIELNIIPDSLRIIHNRY